jgi:xanthine dehydrogenase accessory factor
LQQDRFSYFGLIGSRAKRLNFERRLLARGHAQAGIDRMVCPIGMPGIVGKAPEMIALAVAAQLMQHYSAQYA